MVMSSISSVMTSTTGCVSGERRVIMSDNDCLLWEGLGGWMGGRVGSGEGRRGGWWRRLLDCVYMHGPGY